LLLLLGDTAGLPAKRRVRCRCRRYMHTHIHIHICAVPRPRTVTDSPCVGRSLQSQVGLSLAHAVLASRSAEKVCHARLPMRPTRQCYQLRSPLLNERVTGTRLARRRRRRAALWAMYVPYDTCALPHVLSRPDDSLSLSRSVGQLLSSAKLQASRARRSRLQLVERRT